MKRTFIFISTAFLALLLAVELYVQSGLFSRQLRPHVIGPLRELLGDDAEIGRIRANFIPMYLEARDISLPDRNGRQAAAIRKIKVYINPLPLLLKKVRLPSIVLLEPRIHAERTGDGDLNITPILKGIQERMNRSGRSGPSGYALLLKSVTVNQGTLSFKDDATATMISAAGIQATAKVNLAGDRVAVVLKNSGIQFTAPAYPELTGGVTAAARYDRKGVHVESFEVRTADATLSLSGLVASQPDPALNLELSARSGPQTIGKFAKLLRLLRKERKSRIEAKAAIRGTLSNPTAEGAVQLTGISHEDLLLQNANLAFRYGNKHLSVTGENWKISRRNKSIAVDRILAALSYTGGGIDIENCEIQAGDLSLAMSGRADPQQGLDSVLSLESRDRGESLSFLTSVPIEGYVRVDGDLTGVLKSPLFDGAIFSGPLTVRGIPFAKASGRLHYEDKKLSLLSVDVHQRNSRYFFSGSIDFSAQDPVFAARLKVIRSDVGNVVSLFYKRLPLFFSATGDLAFEGTRRDFTGSANLSLESGSAYQESFIRGTVTALLTRDKILFPDVLVEKGSGTVKGSGWIGFNRTYAASIRSMGVRLSEVNLLSGLFLDGAFDLSVESSGTFSLPRVEASLETDEFFLNHASLGPLTAGLDLTDRVLNVHADLDGKRGSINARLGLTRPFSWNGQATFDADAFDPFLILGKQELLGRASFTAAGSVSMKGTGANRANMTGTASFSRLGFSVGNYQIDSEGPANLSLKGDRIGITSLNLSGEGTRLSVSGGARFRKDIDLSFIGTANLSLLRPLFTEVEHSDGTAALRIAVREAWNEPDIAGELIIQNGEIKIRDIPQKFSALTGKLSFDQNRIMIDSLSGEMGGGTVKAAGKGRLGGMKLLDFSTSVLFENVTVRYPEGLTSTLSGELYYDGGPAEQSLSGDVSVRRARYDKRVEWKSMLVDIRKGLHRKRKVEAGRLGDTHVNIRFSGKENIVFQNNLAKIPLDVDVFLQGTVNRPQVLGRISARKGTVYFRQNEFKMVHASADFIDPNRMNPVLDIQAEIQVRDYLIRLAVSGTADRAVVTLLSDPPLPDSDILALLAVGKTGTELKGREAGVGMSEAYSFATGQIQDLVESRARSLTGLDRFQIDPYLSQRDTSVPRVTMGKEIVQDRLYVTYSSNVGSTTPEQIFRVEYILNKHFSLVGERNDVGNTGADIKYRFEFR